MEYPRVLVACPVSKNKDYILREWIAHIKCLTYKNYDILLVDNSHDPDYHKYIESLGVKVHRIEPGNKHSKQYMAECSEYIRKYVLDNDYKYWMSIECDLFPPLNIIEYLMMNGKPVIGAPYMIGNGAKSYPIIQIVDKTGQKQLHWYQMFAYINGTRRPSCGFGVGCCLIYSEVLKLIKMRTNDELTAHADSLFHIDLYNKGIDAYLDTSIIIKHYNMGWNHISDNYIGRLNLNESKVATD